MSVDSGGVLADASRLIKKVRFRLPARMRQNMLLCATEDWLRTRRSLRPQSVRRVEEALRRCTTPEEYFDVAATVFPSHQIRSEISEFLRYAATEKPRVICEIGTAEGGTTFLLTQFLGSAERVLGIDLFVWNSSLLARHRRQGVQLELINGSSHEQRTLERAVELLGNRLVDLLFIDGDHTYAGVARDFAMYRSLVREGGLIVFHDIVPDHVTRYGTRTGRWAGDVPVFWSRIRDLYNHREFVEDRDQDGLGIGVIRYKPGIDLPESATSPSA